MPLKFLDPDRDPDLHQNQVICCQRDIPPSSKLVDNFLSYESINQSTFVKCHKSRANLRRMLTDKTDTSKNSLLGGGTDFLTVLSTYLWHWQDLIAELKSELSGNFSHTITSLCKSPAERDADELRKAMKVTSCTCVYFLPYSVLMLKCVQNDNVQSTVIEDFCFR